jgi:hypothetical protein
VPTSGGRTARRPAHQQAACSTAPQLQLSGPFHTSHLVALLVLLWLGFGADRLRHMAAPGSNAAASCSAQSSEGCLDKLRSTRPRNQPYGKEPDKMEDTAKEPGVWPWPDSLDAVVAAPGSHRVVLENELTRVLEVTIAPGEREPEHTHRWSSVMVVHRPARIRYYTGDTLTFHITQAAGTRRTGPAGQLA